MRGIALTCVVTTMGTNRRYPSVRIFDTQHRVMLEAGGAGKDELVFGSDDLGEAQVAFLKAIKEHPSRVVLLMQRARVMQRSS